jgi:hypothetical protein
MKFLVKVECQIIGKKESHPIGFPKKKVGTTDKRLHLNEQVKCKRHDTQIVDNHTAYK